MYWKYMYMKRQPSYWDGDQNEIRNRFCDAALNYYPQLIEPVCEWRRTWITYYENGGEMQITPGI